MLLLIYHVAIAFQPWGVMIGFITNKKSWDSLWIPMTMLNVWRIPLLFVVSGMGVYFAIQKRSWLGLLRERTLRILVPLLFGTVAIVPISTLLWRKYYNMSTTYDIASLNPGHLWFLANIFLYVLILSPLFVFLKKYPEGIAAKTITRTLGHPLGLLVVVAVIVAEGLIVHPTPYELYAFTWHGFFLGFAAFALGFCFVMSGDPFWRMLQSLRWYLFGAAVAFYTYRFFQYQMRVPVYQISIESILWILTVLAFSSKYLNRPGKLLSYASQAAYPVYILHMVFLQLGATLIFSSDLNVQLQFVLLLLFTFGGSLAVYEGIRRTNLLRPLFGLKMKEDPIT